MKRPGNRIAIPAIAFASLFISAFASKITSVAVIEVSAYEGATRYNTIEISSGTHAPSVPERIAARFSKELNAVLYEGYEFLQGSDLVLRFEFVDYAENKAGIEVESYKLCNKSKSYARMRIVFENKVGDRVSELELHACSNVAAFDDSNDKTLAEAAADVAEYAAQTFK